MPAPKSNLKITIKYNNQKFSINGIELQKGVFSLKRGRSRSKISTATNTEIFDICRRWVSKNGVN